MKRSPVIACVVAAIVIAALWGGDVLSDRSIKLSVVSAAPLYSIPPTDYPNKNPILLTLSPGQHIKVLRMRYGKDFQTFRVEADNGASGWVIYGEGVQQTAMSMREGIQ
jgi:hypothetical protein